MSRVGSAPIPVPDGVKWQSRPDGTVEVTGPLGTLGLRIDLSISLSEEDGHIAVRRPSNARRHRELHGLSRTLVANMVEGVSKGFTKVLQIRGTGYRAQVQNGRIEMQLGFSHPVVLEPSEGISIGLEGQDRIVVKGIDKERVGREAARIRAIRPPEVYKGKGIRYEGEIIKTKPGKAAVGAGAGG